MISVCGLFCAAVSMVMYVSVCKCNRPYSLQLKKEPFHVSEYGPPEGMVE